jgi:hypothetical protein
MWYYVYANMAPYFEVHLHFVVGCTGVQYTIDSLREPSPPYNFTDLGARGLETSYGS